MIKMTYRIVTNGMQEAQQDKHIWELIFKTWDEPKHTISAVVYVDTKRHSYL